MSVTHTPEATSHSPATTITTLFLDVGGVLLTNGWDRHSRARAVERFDLEADVMDERHHQFVRGLEAGRFDLDEYLARVVFFCQRHFTRGEFEAFMLEQSAPHPATIAFMRRLKERHRLKVAAVSNEGRDLTLYRIKTFDLMSLFDVYIGSSFAGVSKPELGIYELALDVTQAEPDRVVYVDDRPLFVEVARGLGLHAIHHTGLATTRTALAELGLTDEPLG